jgi:integrase
MASAEKRDGKLTGFWYGEVDRRHKGGLRFRARFETKKEAEGYEAYVRATGEAPPWATQDGVGAGYTFATVAADCKANYAPWARQRDRSVIQRLEWLCSGKLGAMPIEAIGREDLERLVSDLKARPAKQKGQKLSGSTINRYLTAVSTVLTYAAKDPRKYGKLQRPSLPWQTEGDMREETVSFDQENAICRAITEGGSYAAPACAFLVRVLAASGMRLGELLALRSEQVENDRIRLKAAETKTKASRLIYVGEEMARELRALIVSGGIPSASQLRLAFKTAIKTCGYSNELCLHSLRHTRATRLLEAGVDPQTTMQMMGWTAFTTMQRYRHVSDTLQREAAEKVSLRRGEKASEGVVLPFAAIDKAG